MHGKPSAGCMGSGRETAHQDSSSTAGCSKVFCAQLRGFHIPPAWAAFHNQKDIKLSPPCQCHSIKQDPRCVTLSFPNYALQHKDCLTSSTRWGKAQQVEEKLLDIFMACKYMGLRLENDLVSNLKKGNKKNELTPYYMELSTHYFQHGAFTFSVGDSQVCDYHNVNVSTKIHHVLESEFAFQIALNLGPRY